MAVPIICVIIVVIDAYVIGRYLTSIFRKK